MKIDKNHKNRNVSMHQFLHLSILHRIALIYSTFIYINIVIVLTFIVLRSIIFILNNLNLDGVLCR